MAMEEDDDHGRAIRVEPFRYMNENPAFAVGLMLPEDLPTRRAVASHTIVFKVQEWHSCSRYRAVIGKWR
jgi:hypothetical protein